MCGFFLVVLLMVSECLANYRYGLMSGQKPLGDESATTSSVTLQECGKSCGDSNSPGLLYLTGTSTCICYSRVLGFADVVDSSEVGYIQVSDTYTSCLTVEQHQAIIRNMVYGGATCPPDFDDLSSHCFTDSKTEAECAKYGEFVLLNDTSGDWPQCDLLTNDAVV